MKLLASAVVSSVGAALLLFACNGECEGPACGQDAGPCEMVTRLNLRHVDAILTDEAANPEIVEVIPGSDNRAALVSTKVNLLVEVTYSETAISFTNETLIDTGTLASGLTTVEIAPDGSYGTALFQRADCQLGGVVFFDTTTGANWGQQLGRIDVGYNPDSGWFSQDGRYYVTADEDDRQDHPCKPPDRWGGSVTVIDLSAGPENPRVAQQIPINYELDSEPESLFVANDGTVVVTIQESSDIAVFNLSAVPNAMPQIYSLDDEAQPDGVAITPDSRYAVICQENNDTISVFDLRERRIASTRYLPSTTDIPVDYHQDQRRLFRKNEPSNVTIRTFDGNDYAFVTIQESHAVAAYLIHEDGTLEFDSIAPVGVNWMRELGMSRTRSEIRPEGVTVNAERGLVLVAAEMEGSVSLVAMEPSEECR